MECVLAINSVTFREITQYSPLNFTRRYGETYHLHVQGGRVSNARNQRDSESAGLLLGFFIDPGGDIVFRNVG
jgi:hypothetical protein